MIHVEQEAFKLIAEWQTKGFNGIRFIECHMQPANWSDFEGDGRTREEYENWIRDYACFVAHPDIYDDFGIRDNPYAKSEVDWGHCYSDMIAEIKRRLGDDIEVQHRSGCHEFECHRKTKAGAQPQPEVESAPQCFIGSLNDIFICVPREKIDIFLANLKLALEYFHEGDASYFPFLIWVDDGKIGHTVDDSL